MGCLQMNSRWMGVSDDQFHQRMQERRETLLRVHNSIKSPCRINRTNNGKGWYTTSSKKNPCVTEMLDILKEPIVIFQDSVWRRAEHVYAAPFFPTKFYKASRLSRRQSQWLKEVLEIHCSGGTGCLEIFNWKCFGRSRVWRR